MESRDKLVEAINNHGDIPEIKELLFAVPKDEIIKEDGRHFDILHYAIQENYIEVVHLVFLKGYFAEPHQPKHVPYLNLAYKLGHTAIVGILLKERLYDIGSEVEQVCDKCDFSLENDGKENYKLKVTNSDILHLQNSTPLNLAAEGGHLKCVRMLLNSIDTREVPNQGRKAFKNEKVTTSLLEKAVEKCSTKAVQLLLSSEEVQQNDINSAFKMALHRKLADCMHILLNNASVQVKRILNDMNPYHVLYMYSSAYQANSERNYGLDKATDVLIRHGFDVNDFSKSGSFPLYSLLNSLIEEKDFFPIEIPKYHLNALELLKEGADPNFDEVKNSTNDQKNLYGHTLGRPLHTSALNALFGSLQSCDNWYAMFPEFITHCCGLLLRGGCNPRRVDGRGRTVLHDLMKCLAIENTMGNMDVNIFPIIQILMRYGADPNVSSFSEMYPVSSYFQTLFNLMDGLHAVDNWKSSKCLTQVLYLMNYMKHSSRREASQQIILICQIAEVKSVSGISLVPHVTSMLHQYTHKHLCLQDLCRLQIWESIDRQRDKLHHLPLPTSLRNSVLNYFC